MFSDGRNAALNAYGLKTANIGDTLRNGAAWLRQEAVGAPGTWKRLGEQSRSKTLTAPGGAYHKPLHWLIPKFDFGHAGHGLGERALRTAGSLGSMVAPLGMALSGYQALTAPPEHRGEAVGGLLGSVAGGVLGGPFGIAGQMIGGGLGAAGGGFLGKQIGKVVSPSQESFVSSQ